MKSVVPIWKPVLKVFVAMFKSERFFLFSNFFLPSSVVDDWFFFSDFKQPFALFFMNDLLSAFRNMFLQDFFSLTRLLPSGEFWKACLAKYIFVSPKRVEGGLFLFQCNWNRKPKKGVWLNLFVFAASANEIELVFFLILSLSKLAVGRLRIRWIWRWPKSPAPDNSEEKHHQS